MLRAFVLCAAALGCFNLGAIAQTAGEKKGDGAKTKDDASKSAAKEPAKSKAGEKSPESPKDTPKKVPLDQLRLPNNAIVVVVEDLLKATSLIPRQWVVPIDEWMALQERIKTLEQQLKGERVFPSTCKLVGKLEGDFLSFEAEYIFATRNARTIVSLGLQGAHLRDAQLNKQPAILELDKDDGFNARVDKEGNPHRLTVSFRVPVKKGLTGGLDRSVEFGLPPAAAILLDLQLPAGVKELRWNGFTEKPKTPGRWQVGVDRSKTLTLNWKEPVPASANTPLVTAENQIKVDVDATHLNIVTDLFLEDRRPKTEEWHLYLPPQAKVEAVKGPAGLVGKIEEKGAYAILRVPVTSERWQVTVSQRVPRPNPGVKVPVGPFQVQGAFFQPGGTVQTYSPTHQHGTIVVRMPPEASLGQRLVFTRFGKINQTKNTEQESAFQYVGPGAFEKQPAKAPLDLEWRFEKNQLRTEVRHDLKLKTTRDGYELDVVSQIRIAALFSTVGAIDIKLPAPRPRGVALVATSNPMLGFPGGLSWSGAAAVYFTPWSSSNPDDLAVSDRGSNPLKLVPQDFSGKTRVLWTGGAVKQATLELKNSYRIPASNPRIRLELPRPLDTQDRDARLHLQADDRTEILHGPIGSEEPVPEGHRFGLAWDQAPAFVDLSWRPHHRDIISQSTLDIDLHEHTAQVQQTLRFPRDREPIAGPESKNTQIRLHVPRGIEKVSVLEGEITNHDRQRETLWVRPAVNTSEVIELKLQYDLPIVNKLLDVIHLSPTHGSQEDIKVRVWTATGVSAQVTSDLVQRGLWKNRSIELVRDRDQFPSLVLAGFGTQLPLTLQIDETSSASLAAFLAERAIVQARVGEDGSQQVIARYAVRRINMPYVDVELPMPLPLLRDAEFTLGKRPLTQVKNLDATGKLIRIQLHPHLATLPEILEISYTVPGEAMERGVFWATTILAPILRSDVVIAQMHWQLTTPAPVLAASFGRSVRTDTRWGLHTWLLTPECSAPEAEAWINGRDSGATSPVTFAFTLVSPQPETVVHLPRSWWLLGCSGIFLIVTLGTFYSPVPRWSYILLLGALSAGLAVITLLYPAAWPAIAYGLQPGVVLFVIFAGIQWAIQERYRRQVVFLPGFSRPKSGSTITRSSPAKRPREASTVDAPAGSLEGVPPASAPPPSGT